MAKVRDKRKLQMENRAENKNPVKNYVFFQRSISAWKTWDELERKNKVYIEREKANQKQIEREKRRRVKKKKKKSNRKRRMDK